MSFLMIPCSLVTYTLLISLTTNIQGFELQQGEEKNENVPWTPPQSDPLVAYAHKRQFGQIKFGKRPFGNLKFGKRSQETIDSTMETEDRSSQFKRPFGPMFMYGKRQTSNTEQSIIPEVPSKRYSDVLDNLYLQTVLHKLNARSDPWNKRAKILFGKRSSDEERLLRQAMNDKKRYKLKFGKRSADSISSLDWKDMDLNN